MISAFCILMSGLCLPSWQLVFSATSLSSEGICTRSTVGSVPFGDCFVGFPTGQMFRGTASCAGMIIVDAGMRIVQEAT